MKQHKRITAAIVLVIIAAVLLFFVVRAGGERRLILSDDDTGRTLLSVDVRDGDTFSITFVHSVNNTPVTDYYEIRGDRFYVTATKYYGFGAGVQAQLEEGQILTYTDDGAMLISGFDRDMTGMVYVVGMVSDHTLELNGTVYSLRQLCGRGTAVRFTLA